MQETASLFSRMLPLSLAASVPFGGTEEAAGARHGPNHPASEQLVSPLGVSMQSISGVSDLRRSQFLMIGINAATPPDFHPLYTHTHTHHSLLTE